MVLSNAQRQARFRERQKARDAYENEVRDTQIALLEQYLNEARSAIGLPARQLPKMAAPRPE